MRKELEQKELEQTKLRQFIDFINKKSEFGKKLIRIKQQKKNKKEEFYIQPIYRNNKLDGINVEKESLPLDTILKLEIFEVVINTLSKSENNPFSKGKAQIKVKPDKKLKDDTLENIIAIKCYNKSEGSVYRRIPVIANILVQAGICENIRSGSKLKLIS